MSANDNQHAGLTEEETAALAELEEQLSDTDADDPLFDPKEAVAAQDQANSERQEEPEEEEQEEEQEAEPAEGENAEPEADAGEKKEPDEEDPFSVAAVTAPRTPLLNAHAPEDAEERLEAIATKKAALAEAFDDGDKTSKEYQSELDALNREERQLERAMDKAVLARELEEQRITNERMSEINAFLREVSIPNDGKNLRFQALNAAVIAVANDPANNSLSVREHMQKSYDACVAEGILPARKAADAKPATTIKPKTPIKAPPTLASIPASEINNTEDNRFAYLNRITDPDKREAAFMKLSGADQEAYLATGG